MASSTPATSVNEVFGWSFDTILARDLPNCMTRPPPAPWDWFMIQMKAPMISTTGISWNRKDRMAEPFCGSTATTTPLVWRSSVSFSCTAAG